MRSLPARWLVCALLAGAATARAQSSSDVRVPGSPWLSNIEMARATALGGAHSAAATGNDALTNNPAGLATARKYHFELDGVLDGGFHTQGLIASITDSTTGPVASGLFYAHWGSGKDDGRAQGWMAGFGYAYQAGSFLFGGLTKYLRFRIPTSDDNPDGTNYRFVQDFGLLSRRGDFSLALVVQNISTSSMPLFPLTATAGFALGNDASSHFAFDYKADLHDLDHPQHKLAAGYEFVLDAFALRAGGTWDASHSLWWVSAGLGILTEKGRAQIAYRRRLTGDVDHVLEAGFTVYLE